MARASTASRRIAPSPYANVGINVIRAIASYAGKPVAMIRDGRKAKGYALIDSWRYTIAPPGQPAALPRPISPWWTCPTWRCCRAVAQPALGLDGRRPGAGNLGTAR
jgi:hypothetical protein